MFVIIDFDFVLFSHRGDAFLESYIDGLARSQDPAVGGPEDEDQDDGNHLIRDEQKRFQDGSEDFADGRDFKFNNLSQVRVAFYNLVVVFFII